MMDLDGLTHAAKHGSGFFGSQGLHVTVSVLCVAIPTPYQKPNVASCVGLAHQKIDACSNSSKTAAQDFRRGAEPLMKAYAAKQR